MNDKLNDTGSPGLNRRNALILKAVVTEYIESVLPVSSGAITSKYFPETSAAGIRAVMAELEKDGYLKKAHKSSGRVPTEKCFRLYVDALAELKEPTAFQKEFLETACGLPLTPLGIMRNASKGLSDLTHCAGFVLMPGIDKSVIKTIRLMQSSADSVLVVIVTGSGAVLSRLVKTPLNNKRLDTDRMSNYLNSIAEGLTLKGLKDKVLAEMMDEKILYDSLLNEALRLSKAALSETQESSGELHIEGAANVAGQPEFKKNAERMRMVFSAFEQKGLIVELLDKTLNTHGTNILIGSELSAEGFDGLSLIMAPYGSASCPSGTVGVIGPVRMDYSNFIPLVGYAARLLDKAI